jgi:hypothetical protein
MTDISITPGSVLPGAGAVKESGTFGATITAGQSVYRDEADKKYKLADSNSATPAVRETRGIALNGGSNGQPAVIQTGGTITIGATVTAGVAYYLSDTPGGICPVADIGSGEYAGLIGMATTTGAIKLSLNYSGVAPS